MSPRVTQNASIPSEPFVKQMAGETFSANYVIHAYEQGIERGKKDKRLSLQSALKEKFTKNRDNTLELVFNLVSEMLSDGISLRRGWIRSEGINKFDAIIAVPQKTYYAPDFDKYLIRVNELEVVANHLDYHINIWFINNDKLINEDRIIDDGYELKFDIELFSKNFKN
jgi:hypothetical protein